MSDVAVYDKARWHYESAEFPSDVPRDQAFVHTGLFVGWLLQRGLMSDQWLEDFGNLRSAFQLRKKTGPQVFRVMGGSLTDEDLTATGNAFTRAYFDFDKGQYLGDYAKLFGEALPTMYHVQDTWENYEILRDRVDERFAQWQRKEQPQPRGAGWRERGGAGQQPDEADRASSRPRDGNGAWRAAVSCSPFGEHGRGSLSGGGRRTLLSQVMEGL